MALLTQLEPDDVRDACSAHGLAIDTVEPLRAGSVNSNFRLTAVDGAKYFGRLYEEQGDGGALAERQLLEVLAAAGVPTAVPLVPRSADLVHIAGKPFAVYPWVDGEILCQARVRAEHCERLGAALARVHRAGDGAELPAGRFGPAALEARLDGISSGEHVPDDLRRAAEQIRERLEHALVRRRDDLPSGLIHGDLFRDNALWRGTELVALIDFESASRGNFTFDVMVCIQAWCFGDRFDLELVHAFLSGYSRVRALTGAELDAAPVEAALVALRFATTRITDYSLRAPPGEPPLRDFRRFLRRLDEIEAGVLRGVIAKFR